MMNPTFVMGINKEWMMKDDALKLLRVLLTNRWTNRWTEEQMDGQTNRLLLSWLSEPRADQVKNMNTRCPAFVKFSLRKHLHNHQENCQQYSFTYYYFFTFFPRIMLTFSTPICFCVQTRSIPIMCCSKSQIFHENLWEKFEHLYTLCPQKNSTVCFLCVGCFGILRFSALKCI